MPKEIMSTLEYVLKGFEILAAVSGIICWKKWKHTHLKWFIGYLWLIVLAEITGQYLHFLKMPLVNRNMYHYLVIPGEFFFFFWLLSRQREIPGTRKTAIAGAILYLLLWILDTYVLSADAYRSSYWFSSLSYSGGNLVLLVLILMFFVHFSNSPQILYFRNNAVFWVSVGLLIFYLGSFPYFGMRNLMYRSYRETFWVYSYIMMALNCLMYLSFSIGIIWGKPNSTSLS